MEDGSIPEAPIWSDVAELDGNEWRGRVDYVCAGWPCFAAGVHILTRRGYVPIEGVVLGDRVLTHLGRWRRVVETNSRDGAATIRVFANGVPGVVCTREHPFYVRRQRRVGNNHRRQYDGRVLSTPEWLAAGELSGETRVGQVLPRACGASSLTPYRYRTPAYWWLVGRYLADGWRVRRIRHGKVVFHGLGRHRGEAGRVTICCERTEEGEVATGIAAAGYRG
ncbi:MAG: Hint domain-containing protein, partial [Thermoplasmata archaeon]